MCPYGAGFHACTPPAPRFLICSATVMVAIHLQQVTKQYPAGGGSGGTLAVDALTLTIPSGDLFFLLGPSGCGKTTLLRMVAGFITPTAGQVLFDTQDMTRIPPHQRDTGMVFQSPCPSGRT